MENLNLSEEVQARSFPVSLWHFQTGIFDAMLLKVGLMLMLTVSYMVYSWQLRY
jgi:hypothetical protein